MTGVRRRIRGRAPRARPWPWRPFPWHALLIAAWPVLFLAAENAGQVPVGDLLPPLVERLAIAVALLFGLGILFRDLRRGALAATGLLGAWSLFGHAVNLLAPAGMDEGLVLAILGLLVLVLVLAAARLPERIVAGAGRGLTALLAVLVVLALVPIVPAGLGELTATTRAAGRADGRPAAAPGSRDVWVIVLDRYGSQASLEALGGFESELPEWLTEQGFFVAEDAHANYGRTSMSLATLLNGRTLEPEAARMDPGSRDTGPVDALLQDHLLGRFLQGRGYTYLHLGSWFVPTKTSRIADVSLRLAGASDFRALLESTSAGPALDRLLGLPRPPAHHVLHRTAGLFGLRELDRIREMPGPKLVVAHLLLPHEPYVFDEDGSYPSRDERLARGLDEGYRRQMRYTDERIRAFLGRLLDVPAEERPIVLLTADEGPYPDRYAASQATFDWATATTDELVTKYGILTAFLLPGEPRPGAIPPYPGITPVNALAVLLSHGWEGDWRLQPDRIFTSAGWYRPWDLAEVTDRLP